MSQNSRYIKTSPERINQEDKPLATYSNAENNQRALKLFGGFLKWSFVLGVIYIAFASPPNNSKPLAETKQPTSYLIETQNGKVTNLCDVYADGKAHCAR